MTEIMKISLFQGKEIRKTFYNNEWWFVINDVVQSLTDSNDPAQYFKRMKERDPELNKLTDKGGVQIVPPLMLQIETIGGLQKAYCWNTEGIFRLIQSIPSPKAEPFKQWLAKVGYERIEETADPELAFDRAMKTYLRKGYSREWINQRLKSIEVRKDLTDEWGSRGMKEGLEFAILTDEITKTWAEKTVKEYKDFKNLKKENLRDNMTNLELVLNMLGEASTTEISKKQQPEGLEKNKEVARKGGFVAKTARLEIEKHTGESIVTSRNAKQIQSSQNFINSADKLGTVKAKKTIKNYEAEKQKGKLKKLDSFKTLM